MFGSPHFPLEIFEKWKGLLKETENVQTMPSTDE